MGDQGTMQVEGRKLTVIPEPKFGEAQLYGSLNFPKRLRDEYLAKYANEPRSERPEPKEIMVEVDGVKARLFVHANSQPTLIVNDLKMGLTKGPVALWLGPGTEAHFRNLKITARN